MKPSWLIGFIMAFILLSITSGIMEMQWLGEGEMGHLEKLLTEPVILGEVGFWTALWTMVTVAWDWLMVLPILFVTSYAFFQGGWQILWAILYLPVGAGLLVSIVLAAVRGVSSG